MANKFHIITYGCQMNKSDSERIESVLEGLGLSNASSAEEADLIILNTCSVRQSAEDRVYGRLKNFHSLKKQNPKLIIAVTGCMVGRDKKKKFLKKMPDVDLYFTIDELPRLPQMIHSLRPDIAEKKIACDYLQIRPHYHNGFQAFVTIETGCDKYCAYCVVPYARGPVRHRPVADIVAEITELAAKGCLEITLLGQTVNNFKAVDPENFCAENPFQDNFAALLWEINQISGIERLHWTAAHPNHMNDEVIAAMRLPKQVNYLHLAVQSGSNTVLKRMNRPYEAEDYIKTIKKVREARPDIAVATDIIVGFPGETSKDFKKTAELYKRVGFDISYTAMYSPRSGTAAARLYGDDVSREEKKKRWQKLEKLMEKTTLAKNKNYQGREVSVLVEFCNEGVCQGRSSEMKLVEFPSTEDLTGTIQRVIIESPKTWILYGRKI